MPSGTFTGLSIMEQLIRQFHPISYECLTQRDLKEADWLKQVVNGKKLRRRTTKIHGTLTCSTSRPSMKVKSNTTSRIKDIFNMY